MAPFPLPDLLPAPASACVLPDAPPQPTSSPALQREISAPKFSCSFAMGFHMPWLQALALPALGALAAGMEQVPQEKGVNRDGEKEGGDGGGDSPETDDEGVMSWLRATLRKNIKRRMMTKCEKSRGRRRPRSGSPLMRSRSGSSSRRRSRSRSTSRSSRSASCVKRWSAALR